MCGEYQLIDRGDAEVWIDEDPLPVGCDHFDVDGLPWHVERPVRIQLVRRFPHDGRQCNDDQEWDAPYHYLYPGGMRPISAKIKIAPNCRADTAAFGVA